MSVKIGSARIDENGNARGGRAGDQNGREVSTQSWYKHSKGWRVFRAKDPAVAEKIARDMQWACDNSHIGYDQGQRLTLYDVSKPLGFNCNKVRQNCETDCSALVRVCCAYAGVMLPNFRTPTEPAALLDSGDFVELKGSKYTDSDKYLKRGDILCTRTQGHTVVVLSDGSKAGDDDPIPTPPPTEYGQDDTDAADCGPLQRTGRRCLGTCGHALRTGHRFQRQSVGRNQRQRLLAFCLFHGPAGRGALYRPGRRAQVGGL